MNQFRGQSSFRARLLRTFFLFQLLLILLGIGWVTLSFTDGQDSLQEAILLSESQRFLAQLTHDPNLTMPRSQTFSAYKDYEDMPETYQALFHDLPNGLHELYNLQLSPDQTEHELRVLIKPVPFQTSPMYFVSDIPEAQTETLLLHKFISVIVTYVVLSLVIGGWLSWLFARTISRPLETIIKEIQQLRPEDPSTRLNETYVSGEISELARSLNEQNQRIANFLQREQQIMRNVSHELRTPITIIQSSLSLIGVKQLVDQHSEQRVATRLLKKIDRATQDLERMVEAFLWLGRENKVDDSIADATACVEKAIADNHYLTEGKPITLAIDLERQVTIHAKEQLIYIAAANLIRNAFTHTAQGAVTIQLTEHFLMVSDQGPGFGALDQSQAVQPGISSDHSQGFGLGLHIVDQICQRLRWQLEIESTSSGATVRIIFKPSISSAKSLG